MQAAELLHALHIFKISEEEFDLSIVNPIVRRINLFQCLTPFFLVMSNGFSYPALPSTRLTAAITSSASSPPSLMSTPRPAIFVAIVTAPNAPAPGDDLRFLGMFAGIQHLVSDTALQDLFEPIYIPFFETQNLKDNMQVGRIFGIDVGDAKRLNELAQRIRRHLFERLIEGLQLGMRRPSSSRLFACIHTRRTSATCIKRRTGSALSRFESSSEDSTEVVPTSMGRPRTCSRTISITMERSFASNVL